MRVRWRQGDQRWRSGGGGEHDGNPSFYNPVLGTMLHHFLVILFLGKYRTSPPIRPPHLQEEEVAKILMMARGVRCEYLKGCHPHVFVWGEYFQAAILFEFTPNLYHFLGVRASREYQSNVVPSSLLYKTRLVIGMVRLLERLPEIVWITSTKI